MKCDLYATLKVLFGWRRNLVKSLGHKRICYFKPYFRKVFGPFNFIFFVVVLFSPCQILNIFLGERDCRVVVGGLCGRKSSIIYCFGRFSCFSFAEFFFPRFFFRGFFFFNFPEFSYENVNVSLIKRRTAVPIDGLVGIEVAWEILNK